MVVLLNDTSARVTPSKISGAPDLLIEILSPSTEDNDRNLKRRIYERSRVTEYWIVDPSEAAMLQLVLEDGPYIEKPHDKDVQLAILPQVQIPFSQIW